MLYIIFTLIFVTIMLTNQKNKTGRNEYIIVIFVIAIGLLYMMQNDSITIIMSNISEFINSMVQLKETFGKFNNCVSLLAKIIFAFLGLDKKEKVLSNINININIRIG